MQKLFDYTIYFVSAASVEYTPISSFKLTKKYVAMKYEEILKWYVFSSFNFAITGS